MAWLPLGYETKDRKITVVEEEAELVRRIFRRYLELGGVNELVRDLDERGIRTRVQQLSSGKTRGGIPFGRGALYYLLTNRFYIGEVKFKGEILPGRTARDPGSRAVRSGPARNCWPSGRTARSRASRSDQPLSGLLFDDSGYRMIPTHATKAGIRYRYYVSTPLLHGEAKSASAGSVSRIPAADIEEAVAKALKDHLVDESNKTTASNSLTLGCRDDFARFITSVVVHPERLVVQLTSDDKERSDPTEDRLLTIPWQKPPSRRSREILLPHNAFRSEVRPQKIERRIQLVNAIARGRQWLDDIISGQVTSIAQLCAREKCTARQANLTISLAFVAPDLVKATIEGRLPRGIGIERLRDAPTVWSEQFQSLGLSPH